MRARWHIPLHAILEVALIHILWLFRFLGGAGENDEHCTEEDERANEGTSRGGRKMCGHSQPWGPFLRFDILPVSSARAAHLRLAVLDRVVDVTEDESDTVFVRHVER